MPQQRTRWSTHRSCPCGLHAGDCAIDDAHTRCWRVPLELHTRIFETGNDFLLSETGGELNGFWHIDATSDGRWIDRSTHDFCDTVRVEHARASAHMGVSHDAVGQRVEHGWRAGEHHISVARKFEICARLVQTSVELQAVLLQRDGARTKPTVVISAETCDETGAGWCGAGQRFTSVDDDDITSARLDQVECG